jgi:hypothetical protein
VIEALTPLSGTSAAAAIKDIRVAVPFSPSHEQSLAAIFPGSHIAQMDGAQTAASESGNVSIWLLSVVIKRGSWTVFVHFGCVLYAGCVNGIEDKATAYHDHTNDQRMCAYKGCYEFTYILIQAKNQGEDG